VPVQELYFKERKQVYKIVVSFLCANISTYEEADRFLQKIV